MATPIPRGESPFKVHDLASQKNRAHSGAATVMAVAFDLPFTQNATIVAFLITLLAAVVLSPFGVLELGKGELITTLIRLVHLISFATWLGSQVWVTFFAGELV